MGSFYTVTRGKVEHMGTDAGWGLAHVVGVLEVLILLSFSVKSGAKSLTTSVGEDCWSFQERGNVS